MTRFRKLLPLAVLTLALASFVGLSMRAQTKVETSQAVTKAGPSVQDALHRPFHFTFAKPTPLDEAARELSRALSAPVVIDRAALDRLGLKMDDPVQLSLEGVRLKTGLKLLLDQLDLTYSVIPEDNLLVITDASGADDPLQRMRGELKALHRDLHDVQDAVDEVRAALGVDEAGAKMRKPTIIEELPADEAKPSRPKQPEPDGPPGTRPRRGI
jgi:hypothetical protein